MQGKKEICGILFCVNVLACGFLFALKGVNKALFLSFEFAFFSSLFIIFLSFLSYKKNILKRAKKAQFKTLNIFTKKSTTPPKIVKFKAINDDFKPTFKLAFKNLALFFSLAKLGAYAFLALGFLILHKHNLLDILAFLAGISSVLLGIFIFMIWVKYDKF